MCVYYLVHDVHGRWCIYSSFCIFHQVSWIRKRDLHILTFGQVTYTNDARFSVIKSATGDLWTLRIRSVQLRDAGLYECQVSSEPKISKAVRLKVVGEYPLCVHISKRCMWLLLWLPFSPPLSSANNRIERFWRDSAAPRIGICYLYIIGRPFRYTSGPMCIIGLLCLLLLARVQRIPPEY